MNDIGDQTFGTIVINGQPLTDWGEPIPHEDVTIKTDTDGRAQLIKALLNGTQSIMVRSESGGVYQLNFQSIKSDILD